MEYHGAPASWISSHNDLASCQDYDIPEVQFANNLRHKEGAFVDVAERVVPTSTDQSRQTGDVTTWLYYGKSVGSRLILSAVSLIVAAVFCQNFQGTIIQSPYLVFTHDLDTIGRHMAKTEYWTIA